MRAWRLMAPSGTCTVGSQVTPTAPNPTTRCGRLTTRVSPWPVARLRAASGLDIAVRPPRGAVSCTSETLGSTGAVSTEAGSAAWRWYAAISADRDAWPPAAASAPTTSRLITLAAGVSAASTSPSASSCWQAVT